MREIFWNRSEGLFIRDPVAHVACPGPGYSGIMRWWLVVVGLMVSSPAHALRAVGAVGRVSVKNARIPTVIAPNLLLSDSLVSQTAFPTLATNLPAAAPLHLPAHAAPLEAERLIVPVRQVHHEKISESRVTLPKRKRTFAERITSAVQSWTRKKSDAGMPIGFAAKLDAAFDGRDSLTPHHRGDWVTPFGAAPQTYYRSALAASQNVIEGKNERQLVDSVAALAENAGIEIKRKKFRTGDRKYDGFLVVPNAQGSRLNKMAHRVQQRLNTSMVYIPGRSRGVSAMFVASEKRLYLPSFDNSMSYSVILHEIRHAFYTMLLKKGETRLFHLLVLSGVRHRVAPNAHYYPKMLSLEELTTHPKTLRHLIMRLRKQTDSQARRKMMNVLRESIQVYDELLDSAQYNMEGVEKRRGNETLDVREIGNNTFFTRGLVVPPGGDLYSVRLGHGHLFYPVEKPHKPTLWERFFGTNDASAHASLNLKVTLIQELVSKNRPILDELKAEAESEAPRLAVMQMLTNRLIVQTQAADEQFVSRYAAR